MKILVVVMSLIVSFFTSAGFAEKMGGGAGFENSVVSEIILTVPEARYTHRLDLTAVLFRESLWSEEAVTRDLNRVSEIYSQCGIQLGAVTLLSTDMSRLNGDPIDAISEMISTETTRPVILYTSIVFFRGAAWAYNQKIVSNDSKNGVPPARVNTAWITDYVLRPEYKTGRSPGDWIGIEEAKDPANWRRPPEYSTTAHELAHIVGNTGHITENSKNILSSSPLRANDLITIEQCKAFKNFPGMVKI